jgi:hypothetical protein
MDCKNSPLIQKNPIILSNENYHGHKLITLLLFLLLLSFFFLLYIKKDEF